MRIVFYICPQSPVSDCPNKIKGHRNKNIQKTKDLHRTWSVHVLDMLYIFLDTVVVTTGRKTKSISLGLKKKPWILCHSTSVLLNKFNWYPKIKQKCKAGEWSIQEAGKQWRNKILNSGNAKGSSFYIVQLSKMWHMKLNLSVIFPTVVGDKQRHKE